MWRWFWRGLQIAAAAVIFQAAREAGQRAGAASYYTSHPEDAAIDAVRWVYERLPEVQQPGGGTGYGIERRE